MLPELEANKKQQQMATIEKFVKTSAACQRVFGCPDGDVVLTFLKGQIAGFDKDPYQHAFNAGKKRLIEIIEQMMNETEYKKHLEVLQNAGSKTS